MSPLHAGLVHSATTAVPTNSSSGFGLMLALLLVPLVGAAVLTLLRGDDRVARVTALLFGVVEFALAVAALFTYRTGGARIQFSGSAEWVPTFGVHISFGMDGIALVLVAMTAFLTPVVLGGSWAEKLPEGRSLGGFFALILSLEALTIGVFSATDVFLFYVLFELMLLPMYFLIGTYGGINRRYAAVKFFLYSFLAGMIMLASVIGLWSYSSSVTGNGTTDWATLTAVVSHAPLSTQIWLFMGFFFAFAIKAPLVPFHTWLPDATAEAPIGVGVLLVGVLDKVGIFGFLRYSLPLFPDASHTLAPLILVLAVAGVLYGSILAAGQSDMKRFIAYVSLAHFGFMALGAFSFTAQSEAGTVTYMVNHSLATGLLLLAIGMVIVRGRSVHAEDYGGWAKVTPVLAGVFFVAGLATLSLPGTNSFVSEFLVLLGSFPTEPVYAILATFGMVLAALYVLWMYQRVMQGPVRGNALVGAEDLLAGSRIGAVGGPGAATDPALGARKAVGDLTGRERWVVAPVLVLVLLLGFYPKPLLDVVNPAVNATLHSVGAATTQEGK